MDLSDHGLSGDFRINKIIRGWRQRVHMMLGGPITAVFYDTTTLAFESDREDLGELRRKGFSKDHKPHDVPVLFALLITPEGLPLGFRVYPGISMKVIPYSTP